MGKDDLKRNWNIKLAAEETKANDCEADSETDCVILKHSQYVMTMGQGISCCLWGDCNCT
jgi:hypothetical protein